MKVKVALFVILSALSAAVLMLSGAPEAAAQAGAGSITGKLSMRGGGDLSRLVVYLDGVPGRVPRSARVTRRIVQRNRQFEPYLTVVPKGSTIEFPNDDRIFHNVFSLSRTKRFDLGLYRSGASKEVTFRREGEVDVYCNIHPEMEAKILVLDTTHFDVADRAGRFKLDKVPAGTYELVAWQPHGDSAVKKVTVRPGATANVNLELVPGRKPKRHVRKDGTPYGRYR